MYVRFKLLANNSYDVLRDDQEDTYIKVNEIDGDICITVSCADAPEITPKFQEYGPSEGNN